RAGDSRRRERGARRLALSRKRRLPGHRDPPADCARRHGAATPYLLRRPSGRRDRPARRLDPRANLAMCAFVVTGSGPESGTPFVTAGLTPPLRRRGRHVGALKPVASGFDPAKAAASDPGILVAALGEMPTPAAFDLIAPWRFHAPLS